MDRRAQMATDPKVWDKVMRARAHGGWPRPVLDILCSVVVLGQRAQVAFQRKFNVAEDTGLHMLNYGPVSRSTDSSERTAAASRQQQRGDSRLGSNAAQRCSSSSSAAASAFTSVAHPPPLTTESPTTHYCTVQQHVPIDPYAERMPRANCSSNTIRDSISRVAPSLRGPRFAPALRHARRPCALTRGRPAVRRRPGTGRSRRTVRRAALAPAVLR